MSQTINLSHIDEETKKQYNLIKKQVYILIPDKSNDVNALNNIKEQHIISKFLTIDILKNEIENIIKCSENLRTNKNISIDKIDDIYRIIKNIKEKYEILFIKDNHNLSIFKDIYKLLNKKNINIEEELLNVHSNMLNFKFNDDNLTYVSINSLLETFKTEIDTLIVKVKVKKDYYKGYNGKLFYYTIGYVSWLWNWCRYKTIYQSYNDYLSDNLITLRNYITDIVNVNNTILTNLDLLLVYINDQKKYINSKNTNEGLSQGLLDLRVNIDLNINTIKNMLIPLSS